MNKIEKALDGLISSLDPNKEAFYKENIEELKKYAGKKKKPQKAIYVAAFLTESSRKDLYNWWGTYVQRDLYDNVPKHSHMTIKFKPDPEEVLDLPIGEDADKTLTIIGYAYDDKGQAVRVRVSDKSFDRKGGGIAHITISTAEGIPFSYSNELLSKGIIDADGPELEVKIGFYSSKGQIKYDFEDTIYDESIDIPEV